MSTITNKSEINIICQKHNVLYTTINDITELINYCPLFANQLRFYIKNMLWVFISCKNLGC